MNYINDDIYIGTLNNTSMGIAEQMVAGAVFERSSTAFLTDIGGSGSIEIAPSYVILSIQSDKSVRLRLYDTEASLLDAGEIARTFNNTAVSNSIALIADISMSAGSYTMDPAVYAISENLLSPRTYYRVENSSNASIVINYFSIESNTVTPVPGTVYSKSNRRTLIVSRSIAGNGNLTGYLPSSGNPSTTPTNLFVPNTYLLVSTSLSDPTHVVRLRLYTNHNDATSDLSRPFSVEPTGSIEYGTFDTGLIADIILSGSNTTYFTPKIIGSNLQTLRIESADNLSVINRNLTAMKDNTILLAGFNRLYYSLSNLTSNTSYVTASIHVYTLED